MGCERAQKERLVDVDLSFAQEVKDRTVMPNVVEPLTLPCQQVLDQPRDAPAGADSSTRGRDRFARDVENRDVGEVPREQMVDEIGLTASYVDGRVVGANAEFVKQLEREHGLALVPAPGFFVPTEVNGVPMALSPRGRCDTVVHPRDGTDAIVRPRRVGTRTLVTRTADVGERHVLGAPSDSNSLSLATPWTGFTLMGRGEYVRTMQIELVTLVVRDYDEAIDFFVNILGFSLTEDSPSLTNAGEAKRWVVVRPPNGETGLVLAQADGEEQLGVIGNQTGGRVGFFLRVDDFSVTFDRLRGAGVEFLSSPRDEPYGKVVVFRDLFGNRWDLLGPKPALFVDAPSLH